MSDILKEQHLKAIESESVGNTILSTEALVYKHEQITLEHMGKFAQWVDKLSPIDRCTV